MDKEMIQLPPIPKDSSAEFVEILWLYARMNRMERENVEGLMKAMLDDSADIYSTSFVKSSIPGKEDPDVKEFSELMRKTLGHLFAQACKAAAATYQSCLVEGKTVREAAEMSGYGEGIIRLMAEYYEMRSSGPLKNG